MNNIFKNLFKSKKIEPSIRVLTNKDLIITAGRWCPNCKDNGAFFYYNSSYFYYNSSLKFRPAIYLCENCRKNWTEEEYNILIQIAQRKQKLEKINKVINDNNL